MGKDSSVIAWRTPVNRPLSPIDRALAAHYHECHKMPVHEIARLLRITESDVLASVSHEREHER